MMDKLGNIDFVKIYDNIKPRRIEWHGDVGKDIELEEYYSAAFVQYCQLWYVGIID